MINDAKILKAILWEYFQKCSLKSYIFEDFLKICLWGEQVSKIFFKKDVSNGNFSIIFNEIKMYKNNFDKIFAIKRKVMENVR